MASIPPPPPPPGPPGPTVPPQNPYHPPEAPSGGGSGDPFIEQQLSAPSTGLLVTGILLGIWALGGLAWNLFFGMAGMMGGREMPEQFFGLFAGTLGIVGGGIGLAVAGFIIYASQQMKKQEHWELCVAASIVGMVPCVSPCCFLGLPMGIWSLVVLLKPEVKTAFR